MPELRIKAPCPFCGETEHLNVSQGAIPRPIMRDGDTVKGADGMEEFEEADGVFCEVCCGSAPLDVWNNEVPYEVFAVLCDFDPQDRAEIVRDRGETSTPQGISTGAEVALVEIAA